MEKYQLNANDSLQKSEAGLNRLESAPVNVTFKTSAQLSTFNAPCKNELLKTISNLTKVKIHWLLIFRISPLLWNDCVAQESHSLL